MFEGFANVWTPVCEISRLGAAPVRLEVAGEGLVLFRAPDGRVGALLDRCPHRGVRLSLGKLRSDGCLECPFHGWRFDVEGSNRHVPLNPDARREALGAQALPTRILGDLVWVYTSVTSTPTHEPSPPEDLAAPGVARTYVSRDWSCHWTRAMENMLDTPHLPFVHSRSIGRPLLRRMRQDSKMEIDWEDTPFGGRTRVHLDGRSGGGELSFFRPNMMELQIPIPGRRFRIHALVLPLGGDRTRLTVVATRDFLRAGIFDGLFRHSSRRIADEDRAVVESSPAGEVPPPGREPSVGTDRATLQFRSYYHRVLRPSVA